jgi:hypothetical protein
MAGQTFNITVLSHGSQPGREQKQTESQIAAVETSLDEIHLIQ